jgi:hypothetical protein
MLARSVFIASMFLLLHTAGCEQVKQQQTSSPNSADPQWEYIVVSYGKTLFENPQKTLAYRTLGLSGGSEAIAFESNLDIMGRFGWELVAIVGQIGGDQQLVLKRRYDKARSANESGMILQGKEVYLKDLADIIERSNRLAEEARLQAEAEKNKPQLVDLDALDEQAAQHRKFQALEKSYVAAFQRTDLAPSSTITVKSSFSGGVIVDIRTNLTENFLKDGNSYRRKDVAAYLKSQIQQYRFRDSALGKFYEVNISVSGFIRFSGKEVDVGEYKTRYSSILDRWED